MNKSITSLIVVLLLAVAIGKAQNITRVAHFDKVIVSPHIKVTFVEGQEETVTIENSTVSKDKINIEVNGKTLRIYLDGAKEVEKNETTYENGNKLKRPIYQGTVVTATVVYKTLQELSIRGEEEIVCQSLLKGDMFTLNIYGESAVSLNEVQLRELKTTIYGESTLLIKAGSIKEQRYIAYGESKINSLGTTGSISRITVYGESDFKLNVSDEIKLTAFGEAVVAYKGNPTITKGIKLGEVTLNKLD